MIENCIIVTLPKFTDERGNLTFIEGGNHVFFDIKRVYYLYDVPENISRGGHAHKNLHQLFIAISGTFDVCLDDGYSKKIVRLENKYQGLYVCPMIWREITNFSENAVCMVLASNSYNEDDYYRQYSDFIANAKN